MRVGIFGGTFDPIHRGHINAALEFYKRCELDKMYVIPTGIPPHKCGVTASGEHRFCMTKAAFDEYRSKGFNIEVSDMEIRESGKCYTIYTAEKIASRNKCGKLYVYTGTDMFCSIETWYRFRDLFELCIFTAAPRDDGDLDKLKEHAEHYNKVYGAETLIMDFSPVEMTSTEIRSLISSLTLTGENDGNYESIFDILTKRYLTEPVAKYIISNRLYFDECCQNKDEELPAISEALLSEIEATALDGISEKRRAHILSVTEEALRMANLIFPLCGISEEFKRDIKAAALLHDLTKEKSFDEQLEFCRANKILLTEDDLDSPLTIHSITGAYSAKQRFNVNDRIANAILRHTTGDGKMNIFDKIIFLADYIEPTRTYDACRALHDEFYSKAAGLKTCADAERLLDECVCISCENTIAALNEKGRRVHGKTLEALRACSN